LSDTAFRLVSDFEPRGEQPEAIAALTAALAGGARQVALRGATGTGKTYVLSHVIANLGRPTLVLAPNKTLAEQLCAEFREFFPANAVGYFVSYYDYYQPEAYIVASDTYIEKDTSRNEEIDRLRHFATQSISSRRDTIVVASVSCIYGIGAPAEYQRVTLALRAGARMDRDEAIRRLVEMQYTRTPLTLARGQFRARGDVLEVCPASGGPVVRVELFDDEIERIRLLDPTTGELTGEEAELTLYPANHYITNEERLAEGLAGIEGELDERVAYFKQRERWLEAERINQRTRYDLEMIREVGACSGIENYSRWLDGRQPGEPPYSLLSYFGDDFLMIIDESHISLPQIHSQLAGDRSRKQTLVEYGFRLPSAFDNRPLSFEEFEQRVARVIYSSATPAAYELAHAEAVVDLVVRPTGLVDPEIVVRPVKGQIDDLYAEIQTTIARGERSLVTCLTQRQSEDLAAYLKQLGVKTHYLHAQVDTLDRPRLLRDLRLGVVDVVVGINLLREGLDLPEVSLIAILDADRVGFLRSATSLIQTIGRAARNVNGRVVMYAEGVSPAMREAIDETSRRRAKQIAYNEAHGIQPETIVKAIRELIRADADEAQPAVAAPAPVSDLPPEVLLRLLEQDMRQAAAELDFERAARLRDQIRDLQAGGTVGLASGAEEGRHRDVGTAAGRGRGRARRR
jgi:excinuclease ABC subunit B